MAKSQIFQVTSVQTALLKSNPPKLIIHAEGVTTTLGWENPRLVVHDGELSADGVLDLDFVATLPSGGAGDAFDPVSADYIWEKDAEKVRAVIIYARSGPFSCPVHAPIFPMPPWPLPPDPTRTGPWPLPPGPWPPAPSPLPPEPLSKATTPLSYSGANIIGDAMRRSVMPPADNEALDMGRLLRVCRWSTEDAYAQERRVGVQDHHSPSIPTLHTTSSNWICFFRRHIEPRINSFDPLYANADHNRPFLEQLYPKTFGEIYNALALNIRRANGR